MFTRICSYLQEFWSPEKVILLFSGLVLYFLYKFHPLYFIHCSSVDVSQQIVDCSYFLRESLIGALVDNSLLLIVFLFLLLLLPLTLLRSWGMYVASWSIPLGILLFLSGVSLEPVPGQWLTPVFDATATLQLAVMLWIALLGLFVLYKVVQGYRHKCTSRQ